MAKDRPYWYKLIIHWVKAKGRNGLTIPFIIGAEQFNKPDLSVEQISVWQLLTEIINSDTGDTITLLYCTDIGEYVLGLNHYYNTMKGTEIKNDRTQNTTLLATLSTQILGNNIEDIGQSLTDRYAKCLNDKKYSLINSQWIDFADNDIDMIREALQK